jgi:dihydrofolate reductase
VTADHGIGPRSGRAGCGLPAESGAGAGQDGGGDGGRGQAEGGEAAEDAASWPKVTDEHDQIARALNTLPKYVASRSLPQADWQGTTVLDGDVPAAVADLKRQPGRPLVVVGSGQLARTLREADLVDEYRLWLHPVVLGGGKRLFRDGGPPASFRLADSTTTSGGLVLLTYDRP